MIVKNEKGNNGQLISICSLALTCVPKAKIAMINLKDG